METRFVVIFAIALLCFGCAPPADQPITETVEVDLEAALRTLMKADEALFESHENADEFLSLFADDAVFMPADAPLARGDAIRSTWEALISMPGFDLEWQANDAKVAETGDLGYTIGTYALTLEQGGSLMVTHGKYVTVWSKQADGSWKVQVDCFNANGPPAAVSVS